MKIALVLPDLHNGGIPRVVENLSLGMTKDIEQHIIVLMKKKVNFQYNGKLIELADEGAGYIGKVITFIKRIYLLRKVINKNKYDAIISFGMAANVLSILVKQSSVLIITEHNVKSIENRMNDDGIRFIYHRIYDWLIKNTYNYAEAIVPVSHVIGEDLVNNYKVNKDKIHVIYNGVNAQDINIKKNMDLSIAEKKIFDNPVIINIGRLTAQKGQWHLIKIMPIIRKYIPNVQLVVLGKGDYEKNLNCMIRELNLEDCVHLLGEKDNPYKYLSYADVFVLSSLYEGFPNVLVEAATVGCPIISTDCQSGPREFLLDENMNEYGVLTTSFSIRDGIDNVEINDIEKELAEKIKNILLDSNCLEEMKLNIMTRAQEFTNVKMAEQYIQLINKYK